MTFYFARLRAWLHGWATDHLIECLWSPPIGESGNDTFYLYCRTCGKVFHE